jgi:hypothetical protein
MNRSRSLFLYTILLSIAPSCLVAQEPTALPSRLVEPYHQANIAGLLQTWHRYWDKGHLISWGSQGSSEASPTKPSVVLYDENGQVGRQAIVWFKDSLSVGINDVAVNKAGELMVAGGTRNQAGAIANFIALIGDDNHVSQVIRTTPFLPVYICSAGDGTVWSYGIDRDDEGRGIGSSLRLRHYSFEKGQIGAMLDTSKLNSAGWTLERGEYPGQINLRCTTKEVGLYNGRSGEWIVFDFVANTLSVSKVATLPSPREMQITGFALTEAGDVFASLHDRSSSPPRSGLFVLNVDPANVSRWVTVEDTIGPFLGGAKVWRLLGAEGSDVIYARDLDDMAYWSRIKK